MDAARSRPARLVTAAAFALLLAALLARTFPFAATIDSLICAISVADFRPGFLDGKPTYVFLGQAVAVVNGALGGDRAALMRLLALWSALFAWGMLVAAWLLARELGGGSRSGAWWGVLLVGSSPIFLFMAAIVEKYTVALLLVMIAALFWLKRRYAVFGIFWGLAIGAHVTAALLAVPCAVSLLAEPDRRGDRRRAGLGALRAAAVAAPLYAWVVAASPGAAAYLRGVLHTVFGTYAFLHELRPEQLLAPRAALAILALIAAGAALAFLARRRGSPEAPIEPALWGAGAGATGIVAWTRAPYLPPFLALAGLPLLVVAGLSLALLCVERVRTRHGASRLDPLATFVVPWLATNLLFFMAWDHFYGQFSVFIVPPLALVAARLGARPPGSGRVAVGALALAAAVAAGLWISRDVVDRERWKLTVENDAFAREAARRIPKGSLVVASWDGANLEYYAPGVEVAAVTPGGTTPGAETPGGGGPSDLVASVRAALASGREVYVTSRFLDAPADPIVDAERSALERTFVRVPAGDKLYRIVPRDPGR
ncbi:MAG: glycosyltransferase family 39 protein [Acidobacteria bacterium]|nr:glycosyltransferase family 39 protein [Acidobacteriota bacterium]